MQPWKITAKKVWYFIWEDDSLLSWLVNIVLAVILIKFIVYPGLGFFLGTSHPIVAVVSGSMEHDGSFDEWWSEHQEWYFDKAITAEEFKNYRFRNGFNKGDIMILKHPRDLEVGDVIVFRTNRPEPIIHRIVVKRGEVIETKGDHNKDSDIQERNIQPDQVIGEAILRIPYLGYIKILAVESMCLVSSDMPLCRI